jgi:hypothetical protein
MKLRYKLTLPVLVSGVFTLLGEIASNRLAQAGCNPFGCSQSSAAECNPFGCPKSPMGGDCTPFGCPPSPQPQSNGNNAGNQPIIVIPGNSNNGNSSTRTNNQGQNNFQFCVKQFREEGYSTNYAIKKCKDLQ